MMLTRSPLVLLFSLGALMTPVFAADPSTTPTCGEDPGPSVSCSASNKDWKCPPTNTCGTTSGECLGTFQVCTPAAETTSTKPPKTAAATTTESKPTSTGTSTGTGTGTGTGTAAAATKTAGSGASRLGLSWIVAAGVMGMGAFAGGLVV